MRKPNCELCLVNAAHPYCEWCGISYHSQPAIRFQPIVASYLCVECWEEYIADWYLEPGELSV